MKCAWILLLSALTAAIPARAQQKTGPGITGDDSQISQDGLFFWKVIFDRNPPMLWVNFNHGNVTVWNRDGSGIEVRDVLFGPIDLEASGLEVVHLQTDDTTFGDSSILLPLWGFLEVFILKSLGVDITKWLEPCTCRWCMGALTDCLGAEAENESGAARPRPGRGELAAIQV